MIKKKHIAIILLATASISAHASTPDADIIAHKEKHHKPHKHHKDHTEHKHANAKTIPIHRVEMNFDGSHIDNFHTSLKHIFAVLDASDKLVLTKAIQTSKEIAKTHIQHKSDKGTFKGNPSEEAQKLFLFIFDNKTPSQALSTINFLQPTEQPKSQQYKSKPIRKLYIVVWTVYNMY